MHSLRTRLFALWLLCLAGGGVGMLLVAQLYQQSAQARIGRGEAVIARACDLIRNRFSFYASEWSGPAPDPADPVFRRNLAAVVGLALRNQRDVEGGIWSAQDGFLAYAYPTYPGPGHQAALPESQREAIAALNQQAADDDQPASRTVTAGSQTVLLFACPLSGPLPDLTAWTMTRVREAPGFQPLLWGLGLLLTLFLAMTVALGRTLMVWGRHIRGIETSLAQAGPDGMPGVALTGERELDRIVSALNDAGTRLAAARRQAETMTRRAAQAERMAGLGRVAAGVAHEIRNPIAAARLQGENGLAGDDARRKDAIRDMLAQLDRLDTLVAELLAMTQRVTPAPVLVDLRAFLADCIARHQAVADDRAVSLRVTGAAGQARLDPVMIGRVLDNLLVNAVRHAPEGGEVTVAVERNGGGITLVVEDSGGGLAPGLAGRLFEPFVTSRPEGTGLGLAIARQLADAHGGHLLLRRAGGGQTGKGAAFALELPAGELPAAQLPAAELPAAELPVAELPAASRPGTSAPVMERRRVPAAARGTPDATRNEMPDETPWPRS
ncbi:sensor histidine kinase [Rhodopila sp.]|uniref:sensor histidine kinase n=1 Tax=Rhodopila sp. TaxID=2480087 RepID=UPI002CE8CBC9|nr:HAMP domain-containing sensor histidine kinase [Rhodopila sp.]HVZ09929.1 HAMP domain-containing sensor histidine kinase [Rhodopila sp.]